MNVRSFTANNSEIRWPVIPATNLGASFAMCALVRRTQLGTWQSILAGHDSAGAYRWEFGFNASNQLVFYVANGGQLHAQVTGSLASTSERYFVGMDKVGNTLTFHVMPLSTMVMTHINTNLGGTLNAPASTSGGYISVGEAQDGDDLHARVALWAIWQTRPVTNTVWEGFTSTQGIHDASPTTLVELTQASTSDPIPDLMENTADASGTITGATDTNGIAGTAVVDEPWPEWTFGLDAPPANTVAASNAFPALGHQYNPGSFTAAGRDWAIYANKGLLPNPAVFYKTSTDEGATWSAPTLVRTMSDWAPFESILYLAVHFDGTYLHYAISGATFGTNSIYYRRGQPQSDGTIAWSAAEQIVISGITGSLLELGISVDSSGVPFISYELYGTGSPIPYVTKATAADGTWTTASGHPFNLNANVSHWWTRVLRLNNSGGMIVFYWHDDYVDGSSLPNTVHARVWDGSSWGSEIGIDDPRRSDEFGDGTITGCAPVSDPDAGVAYYAWCDTFGFTWCWVGNGSGGTVEYVTSDAIVTLTLGVGDSGNVYMAAVIGETALEVYTRESGAWGTADSLGTAGAYRAGGLQITERGDRLLVLAQVAYNSVKDAVLWYAIVEDGGGPEEYDVTGTLALALAAAGAATKTGAAAGALPLTVAPAGAVAKTAGTVGAVQLTVTPADDVAKAGATAGAVALSAGVTGAAAKIAAVLGEVAIDLGLAGDVTVEGGVTRSTAGAIGLVLAADGTAAKGAHAAGSVSLATVLSAAAAKNAAAAGAVALAAAIVGDAAKTGQVAASLGLTLEMAGAVSAIGEDTSEGTLALALAIVATASKVAATTGTAVIGLNAEGAASKSAGVTGAALLVASLTGTAAAVKWTAGAVTLSLAMSGAASSTAGEPQPLRALGGFIARAQAGALPRPITGRIR